MQPVDRNQDDVAAGDCRGVHGRRRHRRSRRNLPSHRQLRVPVLRLQAGANAGVQRGGRSVDAHVAELRLLPGLADPAGMGARAAARLGAVRRQGSAMLRRMSAASTFDACAGLHTSKMWHCSSNATPLARSVAPMSCTVEHAEAVAGHGGLHVGRGLLEGFGAVNDVIHGNSRVPSAEDPRVVVVPGVGVEPTRSLRISRSHAGPRAIWRTPVSRRLREVY